MLIAFITAITAIHTYIQLGMFSTGISFIKSYHYKCKVGSRIQFCTKFTFRLCFSC